jgi:hypothetical protein
MSGRIREDDVAYIRDRAPIDEVVADYVQLKSAGGGQKKGLCPFHDEKSPSFHVTPSKGYFHCFGCQTGGDVIAFLMKIDHLTFTETIERLADRIGYTLRYDEGSSGPLGPGLNGTHVVRASPGTFPPVAVLGLDPRHGHEVFGSRLRFHIDRAKCQPSEFESLLVPVHRAISGASVSCIGGAGSVSRASKATCETR